MSRDLIIWIICNPVLGAISGGFFGRAVVLTVEEWLR